MAVFEVIDRGSAHNDGTGDNAREWARKTNDNFAKAANLGEDNTFTGDNTFNGGWVSYGNALITTISSGSITPTRTMIRLDGEGGADDNLNIISTESIPEGAILIIRRNSHIITVTRSGNIKIGDTTRVLNTLSDRLVLQLRGVEWEEISFSDNN